MSSWRHSSGTSLAGPEPAYELEERRTLLGQGGALAVNLHHEPPLALALLHLGVLEGVQAAGVLDGGARGDGGGTVAGERVGVARDPGAGAASVSSHRVRCRPQVAGVQKRGLPLAYTARSGVESQQGDAGICADRVLVRGGQ
jgi:hypothetical protein